LATFSEHGAPVRAVTFMPDGKSIASAGGNRVCVWSAEDAKLVGELAGFTGEVHALQCHGENILAGSADRTARQFKIADRSLVRSVSEHPAPVLSVASHAASQLMSTGCFDGTVTIINLETGEKVRQFSAVPNSVEAASAAK
jgi:WD40 repeat protein